jgi:uncharacterized membrane protein
MTELFKTAAIAFEAVAVLVMILGTVFWLVLCIRQLFQEIKPHQAYRLFRKGFGRTLLLALDLLVAADIILTVTLETVILYLGNAGTACADPNLPALRPGAGGYRPLALARGSKIGRVVV